VTSETLMKFFDNKVALAHMHTKRFHILNREAALIWKSICAGNSRIEIEQLIRGEYEVEPDELSKGIDGLLTMLKSENFISHRS